MKVAILGSGNGGCAAAVDWSLAGHEVRLFDFEKFPSAIAEISKNGGIYAEGNLKGFAPVTYCGHDIKKTIEGADLILAVGPSYSTEPFAKAVKEYIKGEQIYIVCPGSCGGALITKKIFSDNEEASKCIIGETSTLPYAARNIKPGTVMVYLKLKGGLLMSALPSSQADKAIKAFRTVYPFTIKAKNVIQTMLQNANPIIHPSVMMLNAGLVERTGGDFYFYEEGVTPVVGKLIKALDIERIKIGAALGVEIIPDVEIGALQGYMTDTSYEYGYANAPGFKGIKSPSTLDNRYLNEDVGYGLVFMSDLAKKLGIEVPEIDSVIDITSVLMERDYRREALRTLDTLGYSMEEIINA